MKVKIVMKKPRIKKWFSSKKQEVSYKNVTCKNCETIFNGKFCPECGQSVIDYDKPFSFIFYNFAGDFFAFDTRFFRTFVALMYKPGFLSKEYFEGKRVKYAPPFRIFIFASFILFLLLQTYTNKGLSKILDSSLPNKNGVKMDSNVKALTDSIFSEVFVQIDSISDKKSLDKFGLTLNSKDSVKLGYKFDINDFKSMSDLRHSLNKYADVLDEKTKTEPDPKKKATLRKFSRLLNSPEQVVAKILKFMSWAFFLLLPIFASILKLVYIRRKQNYMRHLIFSIHIHSHMFVILIFVIGLHLVFTNNIDTISAFLFLSIPVYFIIALKKFYGQGILKVILKFLTVSFLYNIIFWIVVGFVFWNAFSI